MNITGKIVVVTGAASGIGRELCLRCAREGAAGIVAADLNADGAAITARDCGGLSQRADVTSEPQVQALVDTAIKHYGHIDLFYSNAGVIFRDGDDAPNEHWQTSWNVHVMAHMYAARAVLPGMLARGEGYLLHTASAAGLLSHIENVPYAVTKHAAVAYAEWLSIAYGDKGTRKYRTGSTAPGVPPSLHRKAVEDARKLTQDSAPGSPCNTCLRLAGNTCYHSYCQLLTN